MPAFLVCIYHLCNIKYVSISFHLLWFRFALWLMLLVLMFPLKPACCFYLNCTSEEACECGFDSFSRQVISRQNPRGFLTLPPHASPVFLPLPSYDDFCRDGLLPSPHGPSSLMYSYQRGNTELRREYQLGHDMENYRIFRYGHDLYRNHIVSELLEK